MFILPALSYLKVLPLLEQCLYHFIVSNKSRPPHAGGEVLFPLVLSWPYTLLGLAGQCGYFCTTPAGGRLATTFSVQHVPYTTDLQWNRVSSLEPSRPQSRDLTTRPPRRGLNRTLLLVFSQYTISALVLIYESLYAAFNAP
ncbi:hypothetical protein AVEN_196201-1 [Araneus ventricosus]|uniref:Uncharacterized protein n=1 Tax=Araneus ventricosus TaxID=182803 RepID=A0A4Y2FLZ2_ARAVE|nr:hypothetical protein AVEN_196201-1 [Araneus ventricosus]